MKRSKLAFWLSFLLPGAGLCYVGKWESGAANFFGVLIVGIMLSLLFPRLLAPHSLTQLTVGIAAAFASGVWADSEARKYNARIQSESLPPQAHPGLPPPSVLPETPEDKSRPDRAGE